MARPVTKVRVHYAPYHIPARQYQLPPSRSLDGLRRPADSDWILEWGKRHSKIAQWWRGWWG